MTIHLLCDRCRAEGHAGEDPFAAYGDLLDFTPVPRRKKRADGWDEEVQRAFIAALAATGSARQAAAAVGKAQFGVENLKNAAGNESFMAAYTRALDHFAENRSLRLADGVRSASALANGPRAHAPAWSGAAGRRRALPMPPQPQPSVEQEEKAAFAFLETIFRNYLRKLENEREAREAGRIAEADYYIRQLTWFEVVLDSSGGDGDTFRRLEELRNRDIPLEATAYTPVTRLLDECRRAHWERCGDPPRPGPPAIDLLRDKPGGIATEPASISYEGSREEIEERKRRFEATFAREAEAHVKWEAEARRDFEARRAASQPQNQEPDPAGLPAAEPTGSTSRDSLA